MRLILFTGKGGVGKTTVSAATAMRAAELGYKTLVVSTDPAHSLSDSLDVPLSHEPVKVSKNLHAQEIDVQKELEENWSMVGEHVGTLLEARGMDSVIAEEVGMIPGFEELFSLIEIKNQWDKKTFDLLVVDSAPTGSSLRLLNFPDMLGWYARNVFNISKRTAKILSAAKPLIKSTPLADASIISMIANMNDRVDGLRSILTDRKITTVRIVVNPEKMVIKEAQRAYTYLNLFSVAVDGVVVNKVLPKEVTGEYFHKWKTLQKEYMNLIHEAFDPLPILEVKLFEDEMVGEHMLTRLKKELYGDSDPAKVLFQERAIEFSKNKSGIVIKVKLPFVDKQKLDLLHRGDELILRVGSYKHSIGLPDSLVGKEVKEATFVGDTLHIHFGGQRG